MGSQAYAQALSALRPDESSASAPMRVERAVGLLAGRARCRLTEAHRHLLRMADAQRCDVAEMAGRVIQLLDTVQEQTDLPEMIATLGRSEDLRPRTTPWLTTVQGVLDALHGMSGYFVPERDDDGRLIDLVWAAASPGAFTPDGRHGSQLLGMPVSRHYPRLTAAERCEAYQRVLDTGEPAALGPLRVGDNEYTVRARPLGPGLLLAWDRRDNPGRERDRLDGMEELGKLGWGEWDLVSGEIYWSPQIYRIYEREPSLGPISQEEAELIAVADDQPLRFAALDAFRCAERVDLITRVRIGGRVKHLRTVADAVRDADGRPLRLYGIVQDVTDQQAGAERLAEVEHQLDEQRRTLAAEHEFAALLQRIILPIPEEPIELPGLKAAVRYLPAAGDVAVGGDWYHAAALRDGSVLLAVGDVAGHGTPAATTMAQLRHALRALSVITGDPAALLGHLNRLTCELELQTPEVTSTAVIARYDPARRELVWAQAGHPPPMLNRAGRTRTLSRPQGHILGVVDGATYTNAVTCFLPGDVLLLYTDGLVEHRGKSLDTGLDAVMATVDEAVRAAPLRPLAELVARLRRANPDDDTCILAARPLPGPSSPEVGRIGQLARGTATG
ncbi:transcription antitermination regulator [Actinoplanes sp. OR16]|uniref:SpoIIE family protein phosphatase n=1 Tax=Actinoplanes sp. OR16 TaxID=946334 RepID=UPI000F6F8940|nr:SpoIIE family protein phosphatase [Actinoplanes sp. OR16]BBH70460.1 transcription antitermination regulator [Actinoplanes sp. OR16]